MCKTKTIASKKHFFHQIIKFLLVPKESPEDPQDVPDVRTFRRPSGDVSGTSLAGWVEVFTFPTKTIQNIFNTQQLLKES